MLKNSTEQVGNTKHQRIAKSPLCEIYGTLLRQVRQRGMDHGYRKSLGVTSVTLGAGVTTVTESLAMRAASEAMSVLVVDLEPTRQALTRRLGGRRRTLGFLDFIHCDAELDDCLLQTDDELLQLMTVGRTPGPLAPEVISNGLSVLMERFDLVLFDFPAVGNGGLWRTVAPHLDGVLLVLEAEREDRAEIVHAKRRLEEAGIELTGAVWNKQRH